LTIAKRAVERRLAAGFSGQNPNPNAPNLARLLRAEGERTLDDQKPLAQNEVA
jgi:hypothetical protein